MDFPSPDWVAAFRTALNENPRFLEAAQAWEAEILFVVRAPGPSDPSPGVRLQLSQGRCRTAEYLANAAGVAAEFVFEGTPENWNRLLRGEIDPVRSFIDGTFHVRGNAAKALRFTRAAKELVATAGSVPLSD